LQSEESSKGYLKNWARLIQKTYEVDPLTCPKCHGQMRVISFIEDQDVMHFERFDMAKFRSDEKVK
jgi:hypothetical protein